MKTAVLILAGIISPILLAAVALGIVFELIRVCFGAGMEFVDAIAENEHPN